MEKQQMTLDEFLNEVPPAHRAFVRELHGELMENGCTVQIKTAKSGPVVSYLFEKRVIANYVFRKSGLRIRVYGDHVGSYPQWLDSIPEGMVQAIRKAPACKRLEDPASCNPKCATGYIFDLAGETCRKCRYNAFLFLLSEENNPFLRTLLLEEIKARRTA